MKYIEKTVEPEEFTQWRKTPGVTYENLSGRPKRELRKRLLEDQGYICCYCGCKIKNDENTKIEHVKSQKNNSDKALLFSNMLASCDGGEKDRCDANRNRRKTHSQRIVAPEEHCDAKKGDNEIPVSPLDERIGDLFTYFEDGTVMGTGDGIDLIQTLGLNAECLVSARKNAIESYTEYGMPEDLDAEIKRLKEKDDDGKFTPYCFVLEQYVKGKKKDKELGQKIEINCATESYSRVS